MPADTLKVNLGVPATATPNRFGVLAGDTQGFPNGRRLADDVTDIELRVIGGALLKPEDGGKQLPLGDGVDTNDKPFRDHVPVRRAARQRLRREVRPRSSRPTPRSRSRRPDNATAARLIALAFGAGLAVLSRRAAGPRRRAAVARPV